MHILAALDNPTSGSVTIGEDVGGPTDREVTLLRRKHIGFVFQFFNLLPMLTAEENAAPSRSRERRRSSSRICSNDWGSPTGATTARPSCRAASSRVAIARALVSKPTVVLADGRQATSTRHEPRDPVYVGDRGRPDDGDGHPRRRGGGDRRPHPLPERRLIADERPRSDPAESCRDQPDLRLTRDQGRVEGLAGRKPAPSDRVRDRARRGDGVRHLCPHGPIEASTRSSRSRTRTPTRSSAARPCSGARATRPRPRSPSLCSQIKAARCEDAVGGSVRPDAPGRRNGKSISTEARRTSASASTPRSALQPAEARRWSLAGRPTRSRSTRHRLKHNYRVGQQIGVSCTAQAVPHRRHRRWAVATIGAQ